MKFLRIEKTAFHIYKRLYCCDKPIKNLPEAAKILENKTELNQHQAEPVITEEECAKFEERIFKQVLIEKEQDANLQSRLSKECKIFFGGSQNKAAPIKCSSIRLDPLTLQKDTTDWVTYNFESLESKEPNKNATDGKKFPTVKAEKPASENLGTINKSDGGGTDNSQHVMRRIRGDPGKVLLRFIPEEWWRAFIPKTGVTGFGTFLFTFGTFLVSKEYYVLEHYYYHGLSSLLLWICIIKYAGPVVTKYLDKELDAYEKSWNKDRVNQKQMLDDGIMEELRLQFQTEGQLMLIDVKRENVLLQLEEEYRKRQLYVFNEVRRRLDYHVNVQLVMQRIQQKNLIEYVTREVVKAITPEMQDKLVYYSIDRIIQDLETEKNKNDKK